MSPPCTVCMYIQEHIKSPLSMQIHTCTCTYVSMAIAPFSLSLSLSLTSKVSNVVGGGKLFQHRVETNLRPCLAQLAVAAGKEMMWKPLNHQLLLKTRHKAAEVTTSCTITYPPVIMGTVTNLNRNCTYVHVLWFI